MKKKLFAVKSQVTEAVSLQITPMASIFTVILVFLLKSVSMSVSTVTPSQDLTLPEVKGSADVFEGMRVEISSNSILVDDKAAMKLKNFDFDPKDLADDGSFKALNDTIAREKGVKVAPENENKLLVLADVKTPYGTLKRVFASAANQGYYDMKLIVVEEK